MFQSFVLCYRHPKNENWKHPPWTAAVDMQHMTEKADHRMSFKKIVYQQKSSIWVPIIKVQLQY